MAIKVNDILVQAANEIGIASAGNELGPDDAPVLLFSLNAIRNKWALELQNNRLFDKTYQAVTITDVVTMGEGGNITERPAVIDQITIVQGALNWPIPILTLEEYRTISVPATGGIPCGAYVDTELLQSVHLFPTMQPGWSIRVVGKAYPIQYTNIANNCVDLPEMHNALVLNVAVDCASKFGQAAGEGLQMRAHSAIKHVRNNQFLRNMKDPHAGPFDGGGMRGNIFGGFQ